ncbi:hypothetical protein, partial [Ilumatobacter sp.]|uniref:hypothetical protein n=1 Tax=Ilumatobacter sp. TaxID=1967498 RepID=UPI003C5F52FF
TSTVSDAVDSIPVERLGDIDLPDLPAFDDVVSNTTDFVTESAVVIGATGGRIAGRTVRAAWRNRGVIATAVVIALAVVGLAALVNSRRDSDPDLDIA